MHDLPLSYLQVTRFGVLACSSTPSALRLLTQASHGAAFSGCAEQQAAIAAMHN
jgi:hypothetical protein